MNWNQNLLLKNHLKFEVLSHEVENGDLLRDVAKVGDIGEVEGMRSFSPC